jgi:hypothetical protein
MTADRFASAVAAWQLRSHDPDSHPPILTWLGTGVVGDHDVVGGSGVERGGDLRPQRAGVRGRVDVAARALECDVYVALTVRADEG